MKKIVLAISLAAITIFSGCGAITGDMPAESAAASSGFNYSDMSSAEIIESLAKRMQNNIDTHTFEGFTGGSTFGEVLEKTEKDKIEYAKLKYIDEILGYPAEMTCYFVYNGKDGLSLKSLDYSVLKSGDGSAADILNMLDAELGSRKQSFDGFGFLTYTWEKNGSLVEFYEIDGESGYLAHISLHAPSVIPGKLFEVSDIFPYRLGEDLSIVYRSETPDIITDGSPYSALRYRDAAGVITFLFHAASGKLKLCGGGYDFDTKNMGGMDGTEYLGSIKENMKSILGDPEFKEFPVKSETELIMSWPDIFMRAEWKGGAGIYVAFFEEYFEGTANE